MEYILVSMFGVCLGGACESIGCGLIERPVAFFAIVIPATTVFVAILDKV